MYIQCACISLSSQPQPSNMPGMPVITPQKYWQKVHIHEDQTVPIDTLSVETAGSEDLSFRSSQVPSLRCRLLHLEDQAE